MSILSGQWYCGMVFHPGVVLWTCGSQGVLSTMDKMC
jgi:hypothetical protein